MSFYRGYNKEIHIDVGTDISSATTIEVVVKEPDGTTNIIPASQYSPNVIKIDFVPTKIGTHHFQPRAIIQGKTYAGSIFQVGVLEPLA